MTSSRLDELFPLLRQYRRAVWQECNAAGNDTGEAARTAYAQAEIVKLFLELDQAARGAQ